MGAARGFGRTARGDGIGEMAKQYHKNPRQITAKQYEALAIDLAELGDLGGIVHDLNSDEIIGGNQRSRVFDVNACDVVLTEELHEPDAQGTVAHGYVLWRGNKYAYRQVRWTPRQCERANVVANKRGGTWDFDILANQFEADDLLAWGFEPFELGIDEAGKDAGGDTEAQSAYKEQYGVVVICANEAEQERVYNELTALGLTCKVVVT